MILRSLVSAYEVWGSPEILNKEQQKRAKARQQSYESKTNDRSVEIRPANGFLSALFSLKKTMKEYQKRLAILENVTYDSGKPVRCHRDERKHVLRRFVAFQINTSILAAGGGKVVVAAVLMSVLASSACHPLHSIVHLVMRRMR